jgi:hypothetical protein
MDELAELSVYIRQDLIGDIDFRRGINQKEIAQQIIDNSETFKTE